MDRCFLLGGGPSLENFDYSVLNNCFTIGVNKTFKFYSPSILYIMDARFYDSIHKKEQLLKEDAGIKEKWLLCKSRKFVLAPTGCKKNSKHTLLIESDAELIPRLTSPCVSLDIKKGIYPGSNSGFGALMIAIALGYKDIYLLGYDMRVVNGKTHCHEGYPNQSVERQARHLETFKQCFIKFAQRIKELGVSVINLTPNSALTCFESATSNDILCEECHV